MWKSTNEEEHKTLVAKTLFSETELKSIFRNYPLGCLIDFEPIKEGTVQTNFKVETTEGSFVFRYYENRSRESVLFETYLLKHLTTNGFPCPKPIENHHGDCVGNDLSKPYVVFEYIEGNHIQHPNEDQKKQLIKITAELHKKTKNFLPAYHEHRWNYDIPFCREQARKASDRLGNQDGRKKRDWMERGLQQLQLPESLPKGVCHADLHFSNTLFQNGDLMTLLDFDDANYTYLLFDLVGLIETWAWRHDQDEELNFREAKKIISEYRKHRPIGEKEKRHLFDVYQLSIYIDCLWFFERGSADDFYEKRKIDFLQGIGREKFYQMLFLE